MWWYVVILGCLQAVLFGGSAYPLAENPMHAEEVWGMQPPRPPPAQDSANLEYRLSQLGLYDTDADYYEPSEKRAFTLLSKWHPFTTLNRNVPSIREQNKHLFDGHIETRAMERPVGQPLRWG
ncbi:hypothetical protein CBL_12524 [Carabus blaptoides fortunei]